LTTTWFGRVDMTEMRKWLVLAATYNNRRAISPFVMVVPLASDLLGRLQWYKLEFKRLRERDKRVLELRCAESDARLYRKSDVGSYPDDLLLGHFIADSQTGPTAESVPMSNCLLIVAERGFCWLASKAGGSLRTSTVYWDDVGL